MSADERALSSKRPAPAKPPGCDPDSRRSMSVAEIFGVVSGYLRQQAPYRWGRAAAWRANARPSFRRPDMRPGGGACHSAMWAAEVLHEPRTCGPGTEDVSAAGRQSDHGVRGRANRSPSTLTSTRSLKKQIMSFTDVA